MGDPKLDPIVSWLADELRRLGSMPREHVLRMLKDRGISEVQSLMTLAHGLKEGVLCHDPRAVERIDVAKTERKAAHPERPCVLVIEDDHGVREALSMVLEEEGYQVFSAGDGEEGLRVLAQIARPSVILLDLMMPVMDGWEFLAALRRDPRFSAIPVAIVSAVADRAPPDIRFIRKPINLARLVETVDELRTAARSVA